MAGRFAQGGGVGGAGEGAPALWEGGKATRGARCAEKGLWWGGGVGEGVEQRWLWTPKV